MQPSNDDEGKEIMEGPDRKIKCTCQDNGDVVYEYADGPVKSVYKWKDGGSITEYRNGNKKTEWPEGTVMIEFNNGDRQIVQSDGTKVREFKSDGKREIHFSNGVVRIEHKNGDVVDVHKDGSIKTRKKNGTITLESAAHPMRITYHADGSRELITEDGTKVTVKDGVKTTDFAHGERLIETCKVDHQLQS